jgi:hypothetical protein
MTTIAALPTTWASLETALRERRPVRISYHGRQRIICPHALGQHNGRAIVLGYQTSGQTSTGTLPADPQRRWRCLFIDEIDHLAAADDTSPWGTADNYNPAHPFNAINDVTLAITPDDPTPHS